MNYPEYYKKCRQKYAADGNATNDNTIYETNLLRFGKEDKGRNLGQSYFNMIDLLAEEVDRRFNSPEEHVFSPPGVNTDTEVMRRLKNPFTLPHLEDINEIVASVLEKQYANCYLHTDKVYVYRNIVTENKPHSSWLWHYDNHPTEITKVMIYLTDVTESTGPFEYLLDRKSRPVMIPPSRTGPKHWTTPKWSGSRVPEAVMKDYIAAGCKAVKAVGNKGTTLVFDNNTLHKANVAKSSHRDVLVYQLKPLDRKLTPRINFPEWTGSFEYKDITPEPSQTKQDIKTKW